MKLLDTRLAFYPFKYPWAFEYYERQQQAHWLPSEINLTGDIADWHTKLTPTERQVIGQTLRAFTTLEILVSSYWVKRVCKWFKHPEIQMAAQTNAAFEAIHADSYSKLNISLGLDDFEAFNAEPTTKAKLDRLMDVPGRTREDLARSLAIFSAFTEGVGLFSSFAILLNFSRFNKMKGMGQIISFSIRDESLHSEFGCRLFRELMAEYPELWTDALKRDLYDAARLTVKLEDDFIDKAFELGNIEGLAKDDLKAYIRFRANRKLMDINLKANWKGVDKDAVARLTSWFDLMSAGVEKTDFFSQRPTAYAKGVVDFSRCFDDE